MFVPSAQVAIVAPEVRSVAVAAEIRKVTPTEPARLVHVAAESRTTAPKGS